MSTRPTLKEWEQRLEDGDDCPWPGPRPLTADDEKALLCGRDDDQTRFRQEVDGHKLITLSGRTGVGKSSLLMRGLIPELKAKDYYVATCRDWSGAADQSNAAAFLADRIRPALLDQLAEADLPTGPPLFAHLNHEFGGKVVIVLDQFEELIRDAPEFTTQLFDGIAFLNQRTELKIVISLRSEYSHELRPLEKMLKPLSFRGFVLDDIRDEFAVDVILAGNEQKSGAIDPEFADDLARLWQQARRDAGAANVGLLHLQGILFVLDSIKSGALVDRRTFNTFVDAHKADGAGVDDPKSLFEYALYDSVDIKMNECRQAALDIGLDTYFVEGTALLAARMARHLSSAGYKLVRDAFDLAELSIGADLDTLRRGMAAACQAADDAPDGPLAEAQEHLLLDVLISSLDKGVGSDAATGVDLFSSRGALGHAVDGFADLSPSWSDRFHPGADPLVVDPLGATSGPVMGLAPAAAYVEELRRFAFALEWMCYTQLLRLSSPRPGTVMAALIHDGFGRALSRWAKGTTLSSCGALYGITAPEAGAFIWTQPDGSFLPELDGEAATGDRDFRVLANLRWRGAYIQADFRQVVFANCDFRGSQFQRCRFEGVTFVNCLLDGIMMSDCTIVGRADGIGHDELLSDVDVFEVAGVDDVAATLATYRDVDSTGAILLADRPQLPAIPALPDERRRRLEPDRRGLVIYGGRTSTMLLRRCGFLGDGCFSLRETAGSGVNIVEHTEGGAYEILSSRLRHVSFTSPPSIEYGGEPIDIDIDRSVVCQLWTGSDLVGDLTVSDSVLIQAWNGSPELRAVLVLGPRGEASKHHGLVGFHAEGEHVAIGPDHDIWPTEAIDPDGAWRRVAIGTDYRQNASDLDRSQRRS